MVDEEADEDVDVTTSLSSRERAAHHPEHVVNKRKMQ